MLLPYLDQIQKNYRIILGSSSVQRKNILLLSGLKEVDFEIIPSTFEENLKQDAFSSSIEYVKENSFQKLLNLENIVNAQEQQKAKSISNSFIQIQNDIKIYNNIYFKSQIRLEVIYFLNTIFFIYFIKQLLIQTINYYKVICSDTIISIDDKIIIEKASDKNSAFKILKMLTQKPIHQVYTSVWLGFYNNKNFLFNQNFIVKTDVYFKKNISDQQLHRYIESGEPFGKAGAYAIQGLGASFIERIDGDFYSVWGFPLAEFCSQLIECLNKEQNIQTNS